MSTLFLCRATGPATLHGASLRPLGLIRLNIPYLQAIRHWGSDPTASWLVLEALDGLTLDDHISRSIEREDARERFCERLLHLTSQCREAALWYAEFSDGLRTVGSPEELVMAVREALIAGEHEPAVRMIRSTSSHTQGRQCPASA